jgi:hypothetical protein
MKKSMKSTTFLPILGTTALMLLLGAGCVIPSAETKRTDEELLTVKQEPFLEEEIEVNNDDSGRMAAPEACEEGYLRYSNDTLGFTFCYNPVSISGSNLNNSTDIILEQKEGTLILYPKDLPDYQHTITRLRFDETLAPTQAIETLYMKDADKSTCTVVEINKTEEYAEYVLAGGGDLESQEKCGTYKVGSFRAYENTPGSLFYITIGQDTFMADDAWLKTLEPRAQDPNS